MKGILSESPYRPRRALLMRFPFQPIHLSSRMFGALLGAFSCVWRDSTGKVPVGSCGFWFPMGKIRAAIRRGMGKWPIWAGARRTLHSAGGGAGGASRRIPFGTWRRKGTRGRRAVVLPFNSVRGPVRLADGLDKVKSPFRPLCAPRSAMTRKNAVGGCAHQQGRIVRTSAPGLVSALGAQQVIRPSRRPSRP